jgi:hypothetical protein
MHGPVLRYRNNQLATLGKIRFRTSENGLRSHNQSLSDPLFGNRRLAGRLVLEGGLSQQGASQSGPN